MKNNTLIFGDSYSTFEGYIPEGYAPHYPKNSIHDTDVQSVEDTWWHQVVSEAGLNLIQNNSWSGSTICYTGYNNADCSGSSSFIFRLRELIANGFFADNEINKVFVFGGTNDSWADAPLGEAKFDQWDDQDFYCVLPAICYFFHLLKQTLPQANIYCLINSGLKPEITECFKTVCAQYGATPITFDNIQKEYNHPTREGMKEISATVLKSISTK